MFISHKRTICDTLILVIFTHKFMSVVSQINYNIKLEREERKIQKESRFKCKKLQLCNLYIYSVKNNEGSGTFSKLLSQKLSGYMHTASERSLVKKRRTSYVPQFILKNTQPMLFPCHCL